MADKIKPNEQCPCGSGRKFKKCHGSPVSNETPPRVPPGYTVTRLQNPPRELLEMGRRLQAEAEIKQKRFGLGKPIIATEFKGQRFVAVGNRVYPGKWKTMHEFLSFLIEQTFSAEWGRAELAKPEADQHPLISWHKAMHDAWAAPEAITPENVNFAAMNGAIAAYQALAYSLYLILHNVNDIGQDLIARLKTRDQFHGAYYETLVAATFIKAGFDLKYEDERDKGRQHVEFTATHRATNRQYSVECKARHLENVLGAVKGARNPEALQLHNQLRQALEKPADHARVVFIDVNVPDDASQDVEAAWFDAATRSIEAQGELRVHGQPAPPAYVFLTNLPFHHLPNAQRIRYGMRGVGYKTPDFRTDAGLPDLDVALQIRARHAPMYALFPAFTNQEVPATFDGEMPEVAFGEIARPPQIGETKSFVIEGQAIPFKLAHAVVAEDSGTMHLRYENGAGKAVMQTAKLNALELNAYKQNRGIFFGVGTHAPRNLTDPLEFYDTTLAIMRAMPADALPRQIQNHPNKDQLLLLPYEQLTHEIAKALTYNMMRHRRG